MGFVRDLCVRALQNYFPFLVLPRSSSHLRLMRFEEVCLNELCPHR